MITDIKKISELKEPGKRYNIRVKVENTTPGVQKSSRQEGIMRDDSGTMPFVIWADSGKRYLYSGKGYIFQDVLLTEYKDHLQIKIDEQTLIKSDEISLIKELINPGARHDVRIKVESIDNAVTKSEGQSGTISDQSGKIEFFISAKTGKRYLLTGKGYLLKNVQLEKHNEGIRIEIKEDSRIKAADDNILKHDFEVLHKKQSEVDRLKMQLKEKEEELARERNIIEENRNKTIQAIKVMETKKTELENKKTLQGVYYIIVAGIVLGVLVTSYNHIKDKLDRPKVNDVIEMNVEGQSVPYKVVENNKRDNSITLQSLDHYSEELKFNKPFKLAKADKYKKVKLQEYIEEKSNKIYSYDLKKNEKPVAVVSEEKPAVKKVKPKVTKEKTVSNKKTEAPKKSGSATKTKSIKPAAKTTASKKSVSKTKAKPKKTVGSKSNSKSTTKKKKSKKNTSSKTKPKPKVRKRPVYDVKKELAKVVHINSETNLKILMKLPGIGKKRVQKLIDYRPYFNLYDVMNSRLGIGSYWAQKWREGIEAGLIVFD